MNRHMTTWTARIVAAVAALAAVTGVATADADSADDQFVAALNAHGVPGNRGAEIGIGHELCDLPNLPRIMLWGQQQTPFWTTLRKARGELLAQGVMPGAQMVAFKDATRDAYCPNLDQDFTG